MKRFPVIRNFFYPAALVLIFVLLTVLMIPKGCVFGSHMDWLSQHAALAETIRNACLEQQYSSSGLAQSGRRSKRLSVLLLWFSETGYPDRMSVSADSHGLGPDRLYALCRHDVSTSVLFLAEI